MQRKVVIDTNVLFEGITKQGGASGLIVEAWFNRLLTVYVSTALVYEYEDVLSRKLSSRRWNRLKPLVVSLVEKSLFTSIYFSWRPTSPDPGDDLVIDCAMNAGATVVTSNVRDFTDVAARRSLVLNLAVLTPEQLVTNRF